MDTPIEESNLAHIGSDEDKAARKAAAEIEVDWEVAGKKEGIQIWRVENTRDENGNPNFGINPWPEKLYGEFYNGDSYILLQTTMDEDAGSFVYDIYFWIGSESSQDEYGVAAYKANELDDLLDDAPVQHREVQFHESDDFLKCFKTSLQYREGGIDSGFRDVDESSSDVTIPSRLFHVRRDNRITRCIQVEAKCSSLNQGDAFILNTSSLVYTWFGDECSPFERNKAGEVAHNMVAATNGQAKLVQDVEDDNEDFWNEIGGKGDIKTSSQYESTQFAKVEDAKMFVLSDVDSLLKVEQCEASKDNLVSGDVCMIDIGKTVFIWIGSGSSEREQTQSMVMVQKHIKVLGREGSTNVVRVKEGQESRVSGFDAAF